MKLWWFWKPKIYFSPFTLPRDRSRYRIRMESVRGGRYRMLAFLPNINMNNNNKKTYFLSLSVCSLCHCSDHDMTSLGVKTVTSHLPHFRSFPTAQTYWLTLLAISWPLFSTSVTSISSFHAPPRCGRGSSCTRWGNRRAGATSSGLGPGGARENEKVPWAATEKTRRVSLNCCNAFAFSILSRSSFQFLSNC